MTRPVSWGMAWKHAITGSRGISASHFHMPSCRSLCQSHRLAFKFPNYRCDSHNFHLDNGRGNVSHDMCSISCPAKPHGSNCLLFKWAVTMVTALWLCMTQFFKHYVQWKKWKIIFMTFWVVSILYGSLFKWTIVTKFDKSIQHV